MMGDGAHKRADMIQERHPNVRWLYQYYIKAKKSIEVIYLQKSPAQMV